MKRYLLLLFIISTLFSSAQIDSAYSDCKAQFKYEFNTKIMSPLPITAVNFYDSSEGKVVAWFWEFGDGETSEEQNPLHVYNRPVVAPNVKINPYREVSLTILTADSCKSIYRDTINIMQGIIEPDCKAAFKYYQTEQDSVSGKVFIQFTNLSTGDSLTYFWQFDNEETSTEKEPLISYDASQLESEVCLTVYGPDSCMNIFCDAVYIKNPQDTVVGPYECETAFGYKINYDIQTFAPALVLDFYSKAYPEVVEWKWDFGEGNTSIEENPTHIFNMPQILDSVLSDPNPFREVCLTVTTESGCVATYCEVINIYMIDSSYTEPTDRCQAQFKYHKDESVITIPEVVPFKIYDVSEGKIIGRLWEFEDGTSDTAQIVQKNFDIFVPKHQVCLTIFTADSCINTYCESIYLREPDKDSTIHLTPNYVMRYESDFPVQMSSCAGYVKAMVYLGDSLIDANYFKWSHGVEGAEAKGLCPTKMYSVKAKTPDGTIVSGTFVFNADGTVTEKPVYWWVSGENENPVIQLDINQRGYFAEWRLCDGTIVKADSIPLNLINCNDDESNLILKDSLGNVVYSESINSKSMVTSLSAVKNQREIKIFPNPVQDVLNIQISDGTFKEIQVEIYNITGRTVLEQVIGNIEQGQNIGINVLDLKSGIYLCKVVGENQVIGMKKFTK